MTLTTIQMIAIGVSIVVAIVIAIMVFKKSDETFYFDTSADFQQQPYCKKVSGVDVIVYKTNDSQFPFKKINTINLTYSIDKLNKNILNAKELQANENTKLTETNKSWPTSSLRLFKNYLKPIKNEFNIISTQCKDIVDVYKTNSNVIIASKKESDFLNNLDAYLNTVLYPYLINIKMDDDDDSNNLTNIAVPDSFSEFNTKTNKIGMDNYFDNQTKQVLRISDKLWDQFISSLDTYLTKYPDSGFVKYEWLRDY